MLTATIPYAQYPHGMARLYPITTPGINDRYLADKIYGFPAGPALLTASVGAEGTHAADYASGFDHDFETATPYYYEADLQTWGIKSGAYANPRGGVLSLYLPGQPAWPSRVQPSGRCGHFSCWTNSRPRKRSGPADRCQSGESRWRNPTILLRRILPAAGFLADVAEWSADAQSQTVRKRNWLRQRLSDHGGRGRRSSRRRVLY